MAYGGAPTVRRHIIRCWTRSYVRVPDSPLQLASRLFGGVDKDSWHQCSGANRSRAVLAPVAFSEGEDKQRVQTFDCSRWMSLPGAHSKPFCLPLFRNPFLEGSVRFTSRKKVKRAKAKKKEVLSKIKRMRVASKKRKEDMTPEELLEFRILKATKKIELIDLHLKKFPVQEIPPPDPDVVNLTAEQRHYLKKLGHKNKNYLPVGRRGIFGGTIQNIHLHWKKHETVQVEIAGFSKEEIIVMADQLARLSGGVLIEIHQGNIVILYRGRNYKQPKELIPMKTLDKRKALMKSKLEQSKRATQEYIVKLRKALEVIQKERAEQELQNGTEVGEGNVTEGTMNISKSCAPLVDTQVKTEEENSDSDLDADDLDILSMSSGSSSASSDSDDFDPNYSESEDMDSSNTEDEKSRQMDEKFSQQKAQTLTSEALELHSGEELPDKQVKIEEKDFAVDNLDIPALSSGSSSASSDSEDFDPNDWDVEESDSSDTEDEELRQVDERASQHKEQTLSSKASQVKFGEDIPDVSKTLEIATTSSQESSQKKMD